jgi:hypothetical protein
VRLVQVIWLSLSALVGLLFAGFVLFVLSLLTWMVFDSASRASAGDATGTESFWFPAVLLALFVSFLAWLLYLAVKRPPWLGNPSPRSLRVLGTLFAIIAVTLATGLVEGSSPVQAFAPAYFSVLCFLAAGPRSTPPPPGQGS